MGANREYVERHLPHLDHLLGSSVDEVLAHAEVCVVGCADPVVRAALDNARDRKIIDLVRLPDADTRRADPGYVGLGW
jgi:GDP-mannose 6-dehydrogenase